MAVSRRMLLRGRVRGSMPPPVRPPWALPELEFAAQCERCGDCARACSESVISRGDGGFPELRFDVAGCSLCGECLTACRHGALSARSAVRPLPWVALVASHCLASQRVECRACGDACDARALRFRPRVGGPPMPAVDPQACTGCGSCIAPCPAGAIQLEFNAAKEAAIA